MNELAAFAAALPGMVVGRTLDGSTPPLGLGEPFALLGGDRLGPDGIPLRIMHDHQPTFRRWVTETCRASLEAERPWFRGRPLLLSGTGTGRTHAARWLAHVVGVPHGVVNLSDPVIALNVAASGRVNEALWATPTTVAMAATRCANPVVTVVGADQAGDDVLAGLASMIDPEGGRTWSEDQLGVLVDLGEVTWIIQCDRPGALPAGIRDHATAVTLQHPRRTTESTLVLSVMLEAMADLGIDPADRRFGWRRLRPRLQRHHGSVGQLYAEMVRTLTVLNLSADLIGDAADLDGDQPSFRP